MKILVFYGGARIKGNTKTMVDTFLSECSGEVTFIDAYRYEFKSCIDCRRCLRLLGCSIDDQISQELYSEVDNSDVIVFASPIYFHSVTGELKCLIDRFQTYWASGRRGERISKTKKGVILMTGGAKSFENQFLGGELVLKGALGDMGANVVGMVCAHSTDILNVENNLEVLEEIKKIAINIRSEYE